jgi:ABC-type Fe3+/spermidine/putrescine transport system ATPase subunit
MLKLSDINKRLGEFSLKGINMEIPEGQYYVLLGRSGAGKTQLLELIAGLEKPDSGSIYLDGEDITHTKIQERRIGIVFQDFAIFPHMTVYGNIAYPLKVRKQDEQYIIKKVTDAAKQMNIVHLLNRSTGNLSGGEKQRIALARTLITAPRVLLLDEPLVSLDASLRDDLKKLLRILNRNGQTIIHVTHDYWDAISLASKVGVIHNGRLIQEGSTDEVFKMPVNRFVARYAGIRNFFRLRIKETDGTVTGITPGDLQFRIAVKPESAECLAVLKGDDIKISAANPGENGINKVRCKVEEVIRSEHGFELTLDAGDRFYTNLSINDFRELGIAENDMVWISFAPEALILLSGQTD